MRSRLLDSARSCPRHTRTCNGGAPSLTDRGHAVTVVPLNSPSVRQRRTPRARAQTTPVCLPRAPKKIVDYLCSIFAGSGDLGAVALPHVRSMEERREGALLVTLARLFVPRGLSSGFASSSAASYMSFALSLRRRCMRCRITPTSCIDFDATSSWVSEREPVCSAQASSPFAEHGHDRKSALASLQQEAACCWTVSPSPPLPLRLAEDQQGIGTEETL